MLKDKFNIPIKVMHISSDDLWGGAEAQIFLLLEEFKTNFSSEIKAGILTFNRGALTAKINSGSYAEIFNVDEKIGFFSLLNSSFKYAKKFAPDVIVSHGYKENFVAAIISIVLKAKWVHQIHGNSENYAGVKRTKSMIYSFIETALAKLFADKIICVSNSTRETFKLSNLKKCRVIYNSAKKVDNSVQKKSFDSQKLKIFVIGRLVPIKRIDLTIEAFKKSSLKYPELELHIAGDGPLRIELEDRAFKNEEFKEKIFFHGFLTNPHEVLQTNGDLLILTSDNEGIPTAILEAIHSKIPVIAREVGGVPEIMNRLPDYPLILVDNPDPNYIAKIICETLKDLNILKKRALNCDTSFFEVERSAREHIEIYSELIR